MRLGNAAAIVVSAMVVAGSVEAAAASYSPVGPTLPAGNAIAGVPLTNVTPISLRGDGRTDLAVGNSSTRQILAFPNGGSTFGLPQARAFPNTQFLRIAPFVFTGARRGVVAATPTSLVSTQIAGGALTPGPLIDLPGASPFGGPAVLATRASGIGFVAYYIRGGAAITVRDAGPSGTPSLSALTTTNLPVKLPVGAAHDAGTVAIADASLSGPSAVHFYTPRDATGGLEQFGAPRTLFGRATAVAGHTPKKTEPVFAVAERFTEGDGQINLYARSIGGVAAFEPIYLPVAPTDVAWGDVNGDAFGDLLVQAGGTLVYLGNGKGFTPEPGGPFRTPGDADRGTGVLGTNVFGSGADEIVVSSTSGAGPNLGGLNILGDGSGARPGGCSLVVAATRAAKVLVKGKAIALPGAAGKRDVGVAPCGSTVNAGKGEVVLIQSQGNAPSKGSRVHPRAILRGGSAKLRGFTSKGRRYVRITLTGKGGRCRGTRARASVVGAGRFVLQGRRAAAAFGATAATVRVTEACSGKTTVSVKRGKVQVKPKGRGTVTLVKGKQITR